MPGPGEHDRAAVGFAVGVERGGRARRFGQPQQQFEVGEYGDGVFALHHRVGPQAGAQPAHGGEGARARTADRADGQAEGVVREGQRVVPVAAARGRGPVADGQPHSGDPGQPAGEEFLGDDGGVGPGAFQFQQPGQVPDGVAGVQADQMALPFQWFGGLVVEPDRHAEPAGGLGGEGQRVTGGVSEPGGDLTAARVESGVAEDVGAGQRVVGVREAVEEPAVGGGAARHGLDVPEFRVGQPEAGGQGRAAPVGGFEYEKSAAGTDQGGSGAQELVQSAVEGAGSGQSLGEFVQRGEVGDPARQPVLEERSRRGGHGLQRCGSVR